MSVFVRVTPSRLTLDGDDLYRVATQLDSAARAAQSALASTGGMAGNEDSAQEFIDGYGEGAVNTLNAAGSYAQTLRGLDNLLQDTANAYQDAGTVGTLQAVPARPGSSTSGSAETFSVPSAKAPGPTTPLGEFGEFVMDALAQIGVVLPDADTGKLGDAASAWSSFGASITSAANELDGTLTNLASMDIPQANDIRTSRDLVVEKLREIAKASSGADSLSSLCSKQKEAVEAMWEEIGWFLGQMAAEIALDLGLGALLTLATGGLGAPAVAGKIALTVMRWVQKIAALVQKLVALTRMNALAAKMLLRALAEGTQSAIATVTVQAGVNAIRGPEHAQSLLAVGLGSFAGGGIAGRFGDGGAHVLRINARTGVTRVAANTAVGMGEGAVDGLTDGVVQAAVNGDMSTFNPIQSGVMGSLIGGAARPIAGGTRPGTASPGSGGGVGSTSSPGVDVPSAGSPDAPSAPSSVDAPSVSTPSAPSAVAGGGAPAGSAPAAGGTTTDAPDAPVVDGAADASTPVDASTSVDIPAGDAPLGAGSADAPSVGGGVPDVSLPDAPAPSVADGGSPSTPDSSVPSMPDSSPSTPDATPSTPDSTPSTPGHDAVHTGHERVLHPGHERPLHPGCLDTEHTGHRRSRHPGRRHAQHTRHRRTRHPGRRHAQHTRHRRTRHPGRRHAQHTGHRRTRHPGRRHAQHTRHRRTRHPGRRHAQHTRHRRTRHPRTPGTPDTPDIAAPATPDASTPSSPDTAAPAATASVGAGTVGVGAGAASTPSSPSTSTPDADPGAFEAAVAADAAAADTAADATSTDAPATQSSDADTVDPNALDAEDAVAAGTIAAGAAGVVGLHVGASGGKTPTTPAAPTSPAASTPGGPGSPTAPATPAPATPDATTPDAQQPDAQQPDAQQPEAQQPDAQQGTGSNSTDRTTAEIDAALTAINPNFDPFDPANGYATNCGNTSSILNDFLNGNPTREAPTGTLDVPQMEARTGNPQTRMSPEQIADSLRQMGAGSHCVVGIDRSTGDGHWFNAYFDGDTVWSIDAQTGTRSPWPPNEPNATNWDASIRPEDVAAEAAPEPDASAGDPAAADDGTGSSADDSRTGSDRTPEAKPPAPADVTAADRSDVARPADQQPTIGDAEGGPGTWTEMNRADRGLEDQEWGTGVDRLPNGHPIEYVVPSEAGDVQFDGHQFRGDPPTEIFQEVKGDYDFIYKPFPPGVSVSTKASALIDRWVAQARRQDAAIQGTGGRLEWILTRNPELVSALEDALIDAGIDVDVRYVPRAS